MSECEKCGNEDQLSERDGQDLCQDCADAWDWDHDPCEDCGERLVTFPCDDGANRCERCVEDWQVEAFQEACRAASS